MSHVPLVLVAYGMTHRMIDSMLWLLSPRPFGCNDKAPSCVVELPVG